MNHLEHQKLKPELTFKTKKGSGFLIVASVLWLVFVVIWSKSCTPSTKSIATVMVGALQLPLVFGGSKFQKVEWQVVDNPLQSLCLWLNCGQLLYFPFLVFVFIMLPDYVVMTNAIITAANLFPYAWLYDDNSYSVAAGLISATALVMGINLTSNAMFYIPLATGLIFTALFIALWTFMPVLKKNRMRSPNLYSITQKNSTCLHFLNIS